MSACRTCNLWLPEPTTEPTPPAPEGGYHVGSLDVEEPYQWGTCGLTGDMTHRDEDCEGWE